MRKFRLIAKQFDEGAFYLWIQDNIEDVVRFNELKKDTSSYFEGGQHGYDPSGLIYFGDKSDIKNAINRLKSFLAKIKEYSSLKKKLVQAFKDFNVPKNYSLNYNTRTNKLEEGDIWISYTNIFWESWTKQRVKSQIAYTKFAIKALQGILKIKGSKQQLQHDDDIVYEYDVYGNLINKGIYDYSIWSELEHDNAFYYSSRNYKLSPCFNEKLGIYLIGVNDNYREKINVTGYPKLENVVVDLRYLVGFAVVRNV